MLSCDFPFLYLECITVHCEKFTAPSTETTEVLSLTQSSGKPLLNRY